MVDLEKYPELVGREYLDDATFLEIGRELGAWDSGYLAGIFYAVSEMGRGLDVTLYCRDSYMGAGSLVMLSVLIDEIWNRTGKQINIVGDKGALAWTLLFNRDELNKKCCIHHDHPIERIPLYAEANIVVGQDGLLKVTPDTEVDVITKAARMARENMPVPRGGLSWDKIPQVVSSLVTNSFIHGQPNGQKECYFALERRYMKDGIWFIIAVADLGIGIPASLTKRALPEADETSLILGAMYGVSSDTSRGITQGLTWIQELANANNGQMVVRSGKTGITITEGQHAIYKTEHSFPGTQVKVILGYPSK